MATLDNVSIDIAVVLGKTAMPIHQVLRLGRGAIIELDASEEDEVRILVNNMPVAKGTVIVSGNRIAVEVKKLLLRTPGREPEATGAGLGALSANRRTVTSAHSALFCGALTPHAVVAELVDALA